MDHPLKAGELRFKALVQQPEETGNEDAPAWRDVKEVWAKIDPVGGRESFRTSQMRAETTHLVTLRYDPEYELTEDSRIIAEGTIYYPTEKPRKPQGRNIHWQFQARESQDEPST